MKRNVLCKTLAAIMLATFALLAGAEEVRIIGYESGHYAITDDIEHQLITKVVQPMEMQLPKVPNAAITISVAGYADKTGPSAKNDPIGGARAAAVESFLRTRFPQATFGSYPKGDEANARMVIISLSITPAHEKNPNNGQGNEVKEGWLTLSIRACGVMVCVLLLYFVVIRRLKPQPAVEKSPAPPATPVPQDNETRIFKAVWRGEVLLIPIVKVGDEWHTPFPGRNFSRPKYDEAKSAAKGSLKLDEYQSVIEALIANRTIQVQEERAS